MSETAKEGCHWGRNPLYFLKEYLLYGRLPYLLKNRL
jgi:hypothetical protein